MDPPSLLFVRDTQTLIHERAGPWGGSFHGTEIREERLGFARRGSG